MEKESSVPFSVRLDEIDNGSGYSSSTLVNILDGQARKIGSYKRNYHSHGEATFHPFFLHGRWWALYSKDYTATRVMTLPECEDWCGEEPDGLGFCPVDYYVPRFRPAKDRNGGKVVDAWIGENAEGWNNPDDWGYFDIGETQYCPFGLIAGCIWGDDSSWKFQWLDLSQLPEKALIREERFGYLHLPDNLSLREAVDMELWRPDNPVVGIANKSWRNYDTGELE